LDSISRNSYAVFAASDACREGLPMSGILRTGAKCPWTACASETTGSVSVREPVLSLGDVGLQFQQHPMGCLLELDRSVRD
jgi:hypothetical protein